MSTARTVLAITGKDRIPFLQGLVTNDVAKLGENLVYAALLSPQGKYLFDFFLFQDGETVFLDIAQDRAQALAARLTMYRLRAEALIADSGLSVTRGTTEPPRGAKADPRAAVLGWRLYGDTPARADDTDWDALRVQNVIPESGIELIPDESYILEMGLERLGGVDFRKGCYVGQEVTARMKHKTELRKGLRRVAIRGRAAPGTEILRDGRSAGTLCTVAGDHALAYLRFDRAGPGMVAGTAEITPDDMA